MKSEYLQFDSNAVKEKERSVTCAKVAAMALEWCRREIISPYTAQVYR